MRPIDGRAAQKGDVASVKFAGTIDGEPFEGGSADRLPLVIGEDRLTAPSGLKSPDGGPIAGNYAIRFHLHPSVRVAIAADGQGVVLALGNGETWRVSANAPETRIEESFFLADARGPQPASQIVLAGANGRTLAFGPAHHEDSARPGTTGASIVTGHRDTHFRFLSRLEPGDRIDVQTAQGAVVSYRVLGSNVVDGRLPFKVSGEDGPVLLLVTCYPFDSLVPGGPLRYVVMAEMSDG